MRLVSAGRAIGLPTGSISGKPLDEVAWTGSTKLMGGRSKISMSIPSCQTRGSGYVKISNGKQIRSEEPGDCSHSVGDRFGRRSGNQGGEGRGRDHLRAKRGLGEIQRNATKRR